MTRRELREETFRALFQADFNSASEILDQMDTFLDDAEPPVTEEEDRKYIADKVSDILSHIDAIDARINAAADSWTTKRMAKVDLTLLRLAVYEMQYEGLSEGVAINEAVEISKKYGEENSPSFVNGVLGKIARSAG